MKEKAPKNQEMPHVNFHTYDRNADTKPEPEMRTTHHATAGYMRPTLAFIMHSKHSKRDYIATVKARKMNL